MLRLSGFFAVKQASVLDSLLFYFFALQENCLPPSEVYVGWREVLQALVISLVIIIGDEGLDLIFKIARKKVIFEEDTVLQGLMPALNLSLCLWVAGCAMDVFDLLFIQPFCEIAGNIAGAIIG